MRFFKGQKKRRSFQRIITVVLVLTILLGEFTGVMPLEEAETVQAATNYTIGEVGYVFSDANQYWDISEAQNGSLMAYYFADAINGNKLIIDGDGKMKNYPSLQ